MRSGTPKRAIYGSTRRFAGLASKGRASVSARAAFIHKARRQARWWSNTRGASNAAPAKLPACGSPSRGNIPKAASASSTGTARQNRIFGLPVRVPGFSMLSSVLSPCLRAILQLGEHFSKTDAPDRASARKDERCAFRRKMPRHEEIHMTKNKVATPRDDRPMTAFMSLKKIPLLAGGSMLLLVSLLISCSTSTGQKGPADAAKTEKGEKLRQAG